MIHIIFGMVKHFVEREPQFYLTRRVRRHWSTELTRHTVP
jgi:hypothetical protein